MNSSKAEPQSVNSHGGNISTGQKYSKNQWLPMVAFIFAILVVISNIVTYVVVTKINNSSQIAVARYEVTFIEKQKAYASFMNLVTDSFYAAYEGRQSDLFLTLDKMESAFYAMEPFIDEDTTRAKVWDEIIIFKSLTFSVLEMPTVEQREQVIPSFTAYRKEFRDLLITELFKEAS